MVVSRTVLVLTGADDLTADVVIKEIIDRGGQVARHDLGDFPLRARLSAIHDSNGWSGRLVGPNATTNLDEVVAVYYRRPSRFTFPEGMSQADRTYAEAETRLGVGGVLTALDARWVNHPHHIARAEHKPLQLEIARRVGLTTPLTLIGNDPRELLQFAELAGGPIVCKTLSPMILAEKGQHKITYTTLVDPRTIDHIAFAATVHQLQAWIPKAYDVRATVVGTQVLAVAIDAVSAAARVDWRADYDALRYLPVDVPAEVTAGMLAYLRAFDLHFGGFDFAVTTDQEWIMLECNPSAQWLWLHHTAGLPIPAAMADLLIGTHA